MNSHKNQGNFLTTRGGINRAAHLIVLCNGIDCIMKLICRRNNKIHITATIYRRSNNNRFILPQPINHCCEREAYLQFARQALIVSVPTPDIRHFNEKLREELTIFLDFILTKYFRKRDVNEC